MEIDHPAPSQIDPERQAKARRYAVIRRRLMLVSLAFNAAYVLAWLLSGWSLDLRRWLDTFTQNQWILVAAFAFLFGAGASFYEIPMSYYSGYVLPHRFGLSEQSFKSWLWDNVKGVLVAAPIGLVLLEVVYFILRLAPQNWWLLAAAFLLLFNVILGSLFPVLIAPLFNKYSLLDEEHADLADRLISLAERAGTRIQGVYKFDLSRQTKAANAALAGLGSTRRIILGDTLLEEFTADEIETVLAHELGHHVNRDIPLGIAFGSFTTLVGLYLAALGLEWGVGFFGFSGVDDIAALPLLGLVMGAFGLLTMPLGNAFSRWRERRADAYALDATQKAAAFASAMRRLADQNLADAEPPAWVEWLLHSHPALSKRIAAAQRHPSHPA